MQIIRTLRNRLLAGAVLAALLATAPTPAHAASKEIIELQTQVQQLLDMMQRMQSTLDTRFGVIQHLAEQTTDNSTKVTATVNALQEKLNGQDDAAGGKLDAVSGQVQALNDLIDELKSRISKLDKSVQDLQSQLQNGSGSSTAAAPAGAAPTDAAVPGAGPVVSQTPPLQETFQAGVRDYNAAKYEVATGEFQDVIRYYPLDDLAGQSQFYLGEIAYRQQNYPDAVKAYNAVLEGYPGNPRAAAAQLRKGLSLLQLNQKEAGIHELRGVIQRHPQSPEAAQARTKLNGLGVHVAAR